MQTLRPGRGAAPPDHGLDIRERRSWATWQLGVAGLIFLLVGMIVGYSGKRPSTTTSPAATVSLAGLDTTTVPSRSGSAPPTSAVTTPPQVSAGPPTATPTTPAPPPDASPSVEGCTAPRSILMANTTGRGPTELPSFTSTGPWCIGWAFDCSTAPSGSSSFTISAVPASGQPPLTPAVSQEGRKASGNTSQDGVGANHLRIATDPGCVWGVKVSG